MLPWLMAMRRWVGVECGEERDSVAGKDLGDDEVGTKKSSSIKIMKRKRSRFVRVVSDVVGAMRDKDEVWEDGEERG